MNVLYLICAPAAGGVEVYVKDLAKAAVRRGAKVHIGFLDHASQLGRSTAYENMYLQELKMGGVEFFFIGSSARKRVWRGVSAVREYVRDHDIDICHSHLPYGVMFLGWCGKPVIYTHHSIKPRLPAFGYHVLNRIVDRYVGISTSCARQLEQSTGRSVDLIVNAVDKARLVDLEQDPQKGSAKLQAIAVGRLHPHKGFFFLVDVFALLPRAALGQIELQIVGEGDSDYSQKLRQYIVQKGLSNNIILLGNRTDIANLLSSSDLFLMSSQQEGMPVALIEAAVSGLPCIVTDVGGCREVVETCANGVVIRYGDTINYSKCIAEVIYNRDKLTTYSNGAIRNSWVFDIENACDAHLNLYNEVLVE